MQSETFVVVAHSTGADRGGYVVRTAYDGWLPRPYTDATRLREYRRRDAAQRYADRLYAAACGRES